MSFKGHSINSFKAPLSQFSVDNPPVGDGDSLVNQVIQENAKLDDQLTDMFKHYCDRYKPMGASNLKRNQRGSGMTQDKHTLRKVRNICADAWLKEPSKHTTTVAVNRAQGLSKGHKAFPTAGSVEALSSSENVDTSDIEAQQE